MKNLLSFFILLLMFNVAHAQVTSQSEHKIIFQLTDGDPEIHTKFLRQLNNVLTAAPNAKIEVVTHGMGVDLLFQENNRFDKELNTLKELGVNFVVCENTLKQRKLNKDQFLPLANFVPSAILELVIKQEQGWIYIKAGG
ncbi:DsrE family protein [Shivajiella indica]|uniref:DsrE family protein n=1 Tax=Shivajiella indica TaxID=872115 RepID=A0ABW5BBE6_9BACT